MTAPHNSKEAVRKQQGIEREVLQADKHAVHTDKNAAIQAGARHYPGPPFPARHHHKPGTEADLDPRPMFEAPYWRGSGKLDNKVAIITGGDSGIGRAVAVLFAREGADVAILHLDESQDALETRTAIEAEGRKCLVIAGDVSKQDFCESAVKKVADELGKLDILVNNAAFQMHAKDFDDVTPEHFDLTVKTNLYGYFYMAKAAVRYMKPGSAIINTGSVTGIDGSSRLVDYAMTKGGIHAFTRSLAGNLIERGIRVNCVAPGPVWTPLNPSDAQPEDVAKFGSKSKMKRPAQPEEIAPAYVFLASPQCSSYITGEILPVIGGY